MGRGIGGEMEAGRDVGRIPEAGLLRDGVK